MVMFNGKIGRLFGERGGRRRPARRVRQAARFLALEAMESRVVPAVTATFSPKAAILTVLGDSLNNNITISRNAAGSILVNGGAVHVKGGAPTVANTSLIQ